MSDEYNQIIHALRKIPLFYGLEADELRTVLAICKTDTIAGNEIIFDEGDASHSMYILLSGQVAISTRKNGTLISLGACDLFGEIGLITQRTRSASAMTKTDSKLLRIDHTEFNLLAGKHPRISSILMRNISTNLANHVVRMNNTPLEHIAYTQQTIDDEPLSQILINSP